MGPRKYEAPRRRAASQRTRRRILEAARAIIGGREDLSGFSMESVAERAGVSRMTVYNQFRSRTGLLEALADHLAERGGLSRLGEAFAEDDPARALRRLVEVFVAFWASDRVTLRRIRAMGVVTPSEAARPRERDAWRREAIAHLLGRWGGGPRGRGGSDARDVVDLVSALTSFETFDALAVEGRSVDDVTRLIADAACRAAGLSARPRRGR